jgi:Rad3-related DNA helicase
MSNDNSYFNVKIKFVPPSGIVFIDLETAQSKDPATIVEVGVVILRPGQQPEHRRSFADPGCELEAGCAQVHGIRPQQYEGESAPNEVLQELLGDVLDLPWVAHHAAGMEQVAIQRCCLDWSPLWIDSLLITRLLDPTLGSHSLEMLLREYQVADRETHRALEDAEDTARVLQGLFERARRVIPQSVIEEMIIDLAIEHPGEADLLRSWAPHFEEKVAPTLQVVPTRRRGAKIKTVDKLFSADGLGKKMKEYAPRIGQVEAAHGVLHILQSGSVAGVEAPTGTGKTLAELGAAAQVALETGQPIYYSSHAKALQEQALDKDGPVIERLTGARLSVLMGKDNYLCRVHAQRWLRGDRMPAAGRALLRVLLLQDPQWNISTINYGIKKDERFGWSQWGRRVTARQGGCNPSANQHRDCGYSIALEQAQVAQIIVMNHWVVLEPPTSIPDPAGVILDEAHTLGSAIQSLVSAQISSVQLKSWMKILQGVIAEERRARLADLSTLLNIHERRWDQKHGQNAFDPDQDSRDATLWRELREMTRGIKDEVVEKASQLRQQGTRKARDRADDLMAFLNDELDEATRFLFLLDHRASNQWIASRKSFDEGTYLVVEPLFLGPSFQRMITEAYPAAALVSATMGTQSRPDHILQSLGIHRMEPSRCLPLVQVEDPFDRASNLTVAVIEGVPGDRRSHSHMKAVIEAAAVVARTLEGRTLLYSPSRARCSEYRDQLAEDLLGSGVTLAPSSTQAAAAYLRNDEPVLAIGSDGIGTGVDIPGVGLSAVLIEGIPFAYQDAVIRARKDHRDSSYQSFQIDTLAPALIKLKQVAGRLLRTPQDRGLIVLLDPLASSKNYAGDVKSILHPTHWHPIRYRHIEEDLQALCQNLVPTRPNTGQRAAS